MIEEKIVIGADISHLLADLERRDVALWLHSMPEGKGVDEHLLAFLGLPWRLIVSEISDTALVNLLEKGESATDPMVRKRGFIHVVDENPSKIEIPQRCLPVYLLNGRVGQSVENFKSQLRRMTMLEELRRASVKRILILSGDGDPVPPELKELWSAGFRVRVSFATDMMDAKSRLETWAESVDGHVILSLLSPSTEYIVTEVIGRYSATYSDDQIIVRLRGYSGNTRTLDITELDNPERPLLDDYSLIEEQHLLTLTHNDILEEEFVDFFQDSTNSWRPYAAGLPWERDDGARPRFHHLLERLDTVGPDENCIAYVLSESGAGGTTFVRMIAWECARQGYPVLIAKQIPFVPDALQVANFLNRVRKKYDNLEEVESPVIHDSGDVKPQDTKRSKGKSYETPWVIVFDRVHWEHRDTELHRFLNELKRHGRPACILVVSGPIRGLPYYNSSVFKEIGDLNHTLDQEETHQLGRHLNKFLQLYGKARSPSEWGRFYEAHTINYLEGISTFWIALSFWIQRQYDLSETIQGWVYRSFTEHTEDDNIRYAILEIAALSSERLPMPEDLIPPPVGNDWPTSQRLEDDRATLGALGLVRFDAAGRKYWALAHDILGLFLINALFHDRKNLSKFHFSDARDSNHLQFLLLEKISKKQELGMIDYRDIGDEFAKSIFKIDPDHGRAKFVEFWREALAALDSMATPLRRASRIFNHHTAISRRRIAKADEHVFEITDEERSDLLTRAIADIEYALNMIEYVPGSESDMNLCNSLAHAYLDLADVEEKRGLPHEIVIEYRAKANDAARRAYEENPTNSFVIEMFVKNLLTTARTNSESAIECCIKALGILFAALVSNKESYRTARLDDLADKAVTILSKHVPKNLAERKLTSPIDVLMRAWMDLVQDIDHSFGTALYDIPENNRVCAINTLEHVAGRGNMQVVRLTYELVSITYPQNFKRQIDCLAQLQGTDYRKSPQERLEYAVLLYQNNRAVEGDEIFKGLRRLWSQSEHFVQVPKRLRWLQDNDNGSIKTVQAIMVASEGGARPMAKVREFQNRTAPFRPEEFDKREVRLGARFSGCVSFGHNGPFLRPVTVITT